LWSIEADKGIGFLSVVLTAAMTVSVIFEYVSSRRIYSVADCGVNKNASAAEGETHYDDVFVGSVLSYIKSQA